jgi:hypothetical protein
VPLLLRAHGNDTVSCQQLGALLCVALDRVLGLLGDPTYGAAAGQVVTRAWLGEQVLLPLVRACFRCSRADTVGRPMTSVYCHYRRTGVQVACLAALQ